MRTPERNGIQRPQDRNKSLRRSRKGQAVIEMILLMVVSVGLLMKASSSLKEKKIFDKIIGTPWITATGMIECGVWGDRAAVCKYHPNQIDRSVTLDK